MSLILVLNEWAFQDTPFVEFGLRILFIASLVVLSGALSLRLVPSASLGGILLLRDLHVLLFRHLHGFVHDLNIFGLLDRLEILLIRTLAPRYLQVLRIVRAILIQGEKEFLGLSCYHLSLKGV